MQLEESIRYTLGDIATFKYGTLPKKELVGPKAEYPIYSGYKFSGTYPASNCEKGDLIVVARGVGGTGDVKLSPAKCWLTNLSIKIQADPSILNNKYFYYKYLSNNLRYLDSGSAQSQITITDLQRIEITLPKLSKQSRIASILSSLDDKIELNLQMNKTLEAIAQAIFKEWFVDFRFPGFDGELVDGLPKRWRKDSLDYIACFLNGLALQKFPPKNENDYIPIIKIRELHQGITNESDRASSNLPSEYVINNGDILFSWSGSLEVIIWCGGIGALNQHLFKVSSETYPKWYYYLWTKHHLQSFRRIAESKATTMGHIQRKHLHEAIVNIPDSNTLIEADKILQPLIQKATDCLIANNSLVQIRDLLLPRLMTGKIKV